MSELSNWEVKEDYRMKRDGDYFWDYSEIISFPGKNMLFITWSMVYQKLLWDIKIIFLFNKKNKPSLVARKVYEII